jgi:hypothetical protein
MDLCQENSRRTRRLHFRAGPYDIGAQGFSPVAPLLFWQILGDAQVAQCPGAGAWTLYRRLPGGRSGVQPALFGREELIIILM